MIVELKLSIPNSKLEDVQYHANKLVEMSRDDYPGIYNIGFTGMRGKVKSKDKSIQVTNNIKTVGKLFS